MLVDEITKLKKEITKLKKEILELNTELEKSTHDTKLLELKLKEEIRKELIEETKEGLREQKDINKDLYDKIRVEKIDILIICVSSFTLFLTIGIDTLLLSKIIISVKDWEYIIYTSVVYNVLIIGFISMFNKILQGLIRNKNNKNTKEEKETNYELSIVKMKFFLKLF